MLELLRSRRSIRKFQDRPLTTEQIETLEEALLRAPSARNLKSWEFIFVDDRELLQKLGKVRGGSSGFIGGASLGIVILGNEETADTWIEDASLAAVISQIAATSIGLGSCWAHIRNRDHSPQKTAEGYVREILGIPDPFRVLCVIAVGFPAEEKPFVAKKDLPFGKIHRNRF